MLESEQKKRVMEYAQGVISGRYSFDELETELDRDLYLAVRMEYVKLTREKAAPDEMPGIPGKSPVNTERSLKMRAAWQRRRAKLEAEPAQIQRQDTGTEVTPGQIIKALENALEALKKVKELLQ